jgi:small subunit ribosomal protein S8
MVNDHLSDFITRIRNGYRASMSTMETTSTKTVEKVAKVLVEEGYLESLKKEGGKLHLTLKYKGKEPALTGITRVSKPGARIYSRIKRLPKVLGGWGISILTTPKGIMSSRQAKKLNTGGEIIAQVW